MDITSRSEQQESHFKRRVDRSAATGALSVVSTALPLVQVDGVDRLHDASAGREPFNIDVWFAALPEIAHCAAWHAVRRRREVQKHSETSDKYSVHLAIFHERLKRATEEGNSGCGGTMQKQIQTNNTGPQFCATCSCTLHFHLSDHSEGRVEQHSVEDGDEPRRYRKPPIS